MVMMQASSAANKPAHTPASHGLWKQQEKGWAMPFCCRWNGTERNEGERWWVHCNCAGVAYCLAVFVVALFLKYSTEYSTFAYTVYTTCSMGDCTRTSTVPGIIIISKYRRMKINITYSTCTAGTGTKYFNNIRMPNGS